VKAIWLRQPYPTLIEIGVKQWETRGGPPNGPMRPDGVRGMPGLAIEPGERIAIVASVNRPVGVRELGEWVMFHGGGLVPCMAVASEPIPTPLGVVVCTAVVAEALPIVAETGEHDDEIYLTTNGFLYRQTVTGDPWVASNVQQTDISDQLPYGDWRPGRWAWRLTDAEPVQSRPAPEVTRGNRQGVCEIKETW
jgi:hypothetical protein